FAIRNENNFMRALDEIQQDAASYYVIGYTPSNTTFDSKYRTIAVTVKRPGVKVRARRGYLAIAPALMRTPERSRGANGAEGAKGANSAGANAANGGGAKGAEGAAPMPAPSAPAPSAPLAPSAPAPSAPSAPLAP